MAGKKKKSAAQKKNITRLKKANKACRADHAPFSKSFGKCMKQWFKKN